MYDYNKQMIDWLVFIIGLQGRHTLKTEGLHPKTELLK